MTHAVSEESHTRTPGLCVLSAKDLDYRKVMHSLTLTRAPEAAVMVWGCREGAVELGAFVAKGQWAAAARAAATEAVAMVREVLG